VNHEARDKAAEVWCEKYCASPGEFEESGQREAFYAGHAAAQKEFEESLRVAIIQGAKDCVITLRDLQKISRHQKLWNHSATTEFAPVELSDYLLLNVVETYLKSAGHLFTKEGEK
jgi:hypothetical protein